MIYLQNFGISTALAAKIYQKYGSKVYEILKPILTNLRMISKVLGLKLRMRLRQRLEYIQTLISGSKAGFLCASAVHDRRTCIFAEECFRGKDLQASWC